MYYNKKTNKNKHSRKAFKFLSKKFIHGGSVQKLPRSKSNGQVSSDSYLLKNQHLERTLSNKNIPRYRNGFELLENRHDNFINILKKIL